MTKRILTAIRLDKIAAVGSPCQAPAIAAIIKHAKPKPDTSLKGIAKATFQEALEGNMIAGAVNDAFYQSFDGLWERNDAFRAALADEFAEGGDGTAASDAYVASVKALVDQAVAAARESGATASDTTEIEKAFATAASQWLESRQQETPMLIIKSKAELQAAIKSFDPNKSSVADRDAIVKAASDLSLDAELPAAGPLAKAQTSDTSALEREIAILKMAPEIRKHFDALTATDQPAFLAKSETDRATEVAKKNEGDPVVYKTASGLEIRKSDGAVAAMLAKQADDDRAELAKLRADGAASTIEKAVAKYPNVAKAQVTTILKAATTDTETAAAHETLTAMNKALGGAFRTFGGAGNVVDITKGQADPESPQGKMETIIKSIRDAEPTLSRAQAIVKATAREDYAAAYADDLSDTPMVQQYQPYNG